MAADGSSRTGRATARVRAAARGARRRAGRDAHPRGRQDAQREPRRDRLERDGVQAPRRGREGVARPGGRGDEAGPTELRAQRATRGGGSHPPVQLSDRAPGMAGCGRAGGGERLHRQAQRADATGHPAPRVGVRSPARGTVQRCHRHRRRRRSPGRASRHGHDRVHRLGGGRLANHGGGCPSDQEAAARARRVGSVHRAGRRETRRRRSGWHVRRVPERWAGVHLGGAVLRRGARLRRVHGQRRRGDRRSEDRRSVWRRRRRSADLPSGSRSGPPRDRRYLRPGRVGRPGRSGAAEPEQGLLLRADADRPHRPRTPALRTRDLRTAGHGHARARPRPRDRACQRVELRARRQHLHLQPGDRDARGDRVAGRDRVGQRSAEGQRRCAVRWNEVQRAGAGAGSRGNHRVHAIQACAPGLRPGAIARVVVPL